jgi:hypothetical protein
MMLAEIARDICAHINNFIHQKGRINYVLIEKNHA